MPSPSDMAWLRRLGPVTRRNGTSAAFCYRVRCAATRHRVLAATLPALAGAAVQKTCSALNGRTSSWAPRLRPIVARGGNDRIAAEYDGGVDRISCGTGRDVVSADPRDRIDADCEVVSRRIHRDRHANAESQHESEVEPDSQRSADDGRGVPGRTQPQRRRREHRLLDLEGRRPDLARGHAAGADQTRRRVARRCGRAIRWSHTTRRTESGSRTRSRSGRMRRG